MNLTIIEKLTAAAGARSQEATRDVEADDAPRRRPAYGTRLCIDHRNSDAVSSRQADRHVCGDDSEGGLQKCWQSNALGCTSASKAVPCLRFLLVEAAQAAARIHPDWRLPLQRTPGHASRHKNIAKVAMGRRMAIQLYWMWRNGCEYSQSVQCGSYAGQLGTGHGVK